MILTQETLAVLKNFANISQSIYIKKGNVLKTVSPQKSILAKAKISQEFEKDFAIYDVPNFLAAMSMLESPELDFSSSEYVKILDKNGMRGINYYFTDPTILITPPEKDLPTPTPIVSFSLSAEAIKKTLGAISILGLTNFAFVGDGRRITVQAADSTKTNSNYYDEVGDTEFVFSAIFNRDNIKLMTLDYVVDLNSNFAHFNSSVGEIEYWIAIEQNSKF